MSVENIEINFISDKISSFYIYLLDNGYFSKLPVSKNTDFFKNLKNLHKNLNQRQVKTLKEFCDFVSNRFFSEMKETDKSVCISELQTQFRVYSQFYDKNKEKTNNYLQALNETQKSYIPRLKQIYTFLGVKSDFQCHGIITPVPFKSIDGAGSPSGFYILFTPDKKQGENYVANSLLPERKKYTPLHEAGHVLYANSPVRRNLAEQKGLGARKLLLVLSKYFYDNPDKRKDKNMIPAWNALQCMDEAVAVFSASVSSDKVGYYGWEPADVLSKQFYPLAQKYLEENKPLDDKLYSELAVVFEQKFYQKSINKTQINSQSKER